FNTYKIIDQDEGELARNLNPFSLVILVVLTALKTRNMDDETLLGLKRDLLELMLQRKLSKRNRNGIFNFIRYYVNFENPEMMHIFDKDIEQLTGRRTTMGTEQYLL